MQLWKFLYKTFEATLGHSNSIKTQMELRGRLTQYKIMYENGDRNDRWLYMTWRNITETMDLRVKQNIPKVGDVQILEKVLYVNLSQKQGRGWYVYVQKTERIIYVT